MTCIVGVVGKDGKITMGGDSAGIGGVALTIRRDRKVFKNEDIIMGFTSSFRMGQLLRWKFKQPVHPSDIETEAYMHLYFIDAIRECFKIGGYARIENNREDGGIFLVGYQGRLFEIEGDFQIGESEDNFAACGCGYHLALGSLTTTANYQINPVDRLTLALTAAERYSAGVRRPFHIIDCKGKYRSIICREGGELNDSQGFCSNRNSSGQN